MTAPMLSLRLGHNMTTLSIESDPADRGTQIMPSLADLGGQPGVVGYARWTVRSPSSGPKTFVNEDPAGGAGAIGFDTQFVNWYIYVEATGESCRITATSFALQRFTLATWSTGLVDGAKVQLRWTAPGTTYSAFTYRSSVAGVLPPPPGIPIQDAEVTTLASDVITIRDGWVSTGVPISADGQHVNRLVRLSELVATDVITDFLAVDGEYWYTVADVSAYQVGDWVRRAANNGATWYGDINTLITPAFPAAMTIVEIDSGANAFRVVSRDGGTSWNRTIYDNAGFGAGYTDIRIYRPDATLRTVVDSSASAKTLTLDDTSGFSIGGGPGAVEILIGAASTSGLVPYYLDHPVYAAPTFPGIGVKFRTIERSNWLGVANLVPNAIARQWTTLTSLPDGYLGAASLGAVGSATPSNFIIARNVDSLFTRHGQSIFVSVANGVLYFPPVPWTPMYAGQPFSVRISLILTRWVQNAALITLQLGIMQADGTVIPWYDQPRSVLIQPATSTSPRSDPPYRKFAANVFNDLVLAAFDITEPSTYPVTNRPNAGDITNMGAGLGIVACLTFNAGGGSERIEGYIDGITMVTAPDAPANVDEFHEANKAHQATNAALRDFAKPQTTIAGDFLDLARLGIANEVLPTRGQLALVNSAQLGIVNDVRRLSRVTRNHRKEGDVQIELAPKKRRYENFLASPGGGGSTSGGVPSGGSQGKTDSCSCSGSSGTTGGTTSGGSNLPTITLDATIASDVPTLRGTVSPAVVKVKFVATTTPYATDADAIDAVRLATAVTDTPFTWVGLDGAGSAASPGDTVYGYALAYDNNDVESALATATVDDSAVTGCALSSFALADTPYVQGDDFAGGNPPFTAYTSTADFDVFYLGSTPREAYSSAYDSINDGISHSLDFSTPFYGHPTLKMAFGGSSPNYRGAGWDQYFTNDGDPTEASYSPPAIWKRMRWKAETGVMSDVSATGAFEGLAVFSIGADAWQLAVCNRQGRIKVDLQVQTESNPLAVGGNAHVTTTYDLCDENVFVGAADFGELVALVETDDTAHTMRIRLWAGSACSLAGVSPLMDHTVTAYPRISSFGGAHFSTSGLTLDGAYTSHFNWFFLPTGTVKYLWLADWEVMPTSVDANPFGVALT